ncbi:MULTISPECIES: BON domain-containing protein [unclassified Janthinobacterium]|uniref:BON domain-containing protein n=1 Tax=unclassified Janthinobacterium TaxID=2610881 RepID=UPI001BFD81B3|nr:MULTISPECIES: BON domain-containing protein [unclassified Janthinobacterium]MDN2673347.1 BON domain-containing protein [Janthinobacterium sp. SUN026]MDN2704259.1 BON domain-containing protein [Janthinobacterium sp. SUN100]MDN2717666.1 BON domain-containing protein [Janthinobacterium sp. SUN120]MDO8041444.1 BON domain-containing protein [Janthinobacterium sp. SUN137]MDO8049063.1 BON domain-containing protein [Janthinobacterium sp. SUN211]
MTKFGTGPGWKRVQRPLATALLCGAMLTSLTGCIELMVGGAVMGGVAAADRRTLGAQTEDKSIALKGESRIPSIVGDVGHVNVTSFNRRVLLTGEVRDEAMKNAVEREVRNIEGVESVANELIIAGPASYTSRSNDALITTKVKASLVDMKTISAASFKVVTENATVFLMGRVTQREGTVAADVARGVGGVQKVVKLFDYISEAELKQLQPDPPQQRTTNTVSDTVQQ